MAITIYDVAREANVSMATVSRVVNGNQNVNLQREKKFLIVLNGLVIDRMQLREDSPVRRQQR